jgi:hypothetical protein
MDNPTNKDDNLAKAESEQDTKEEKPDLPNIRAEFANRFKRWNITLPAENVAKRQRGTIAEAGWCIKFIFGIENGVKYLEFSCGHRMLYGEPHVQILESGEHRMLDEMLHVSYNDSEENRLRMEHNERVKQDLIQKKIYLWTGNEDE